MISIGEMPEFRGQIVDIFEDFCDNHGIAIENPEKEEYDEDAGYAGGENTAVIFGSDYDRIAEPLTEAVQEFNMNESPVTSSFVANCISRYIVEIFNDLLDDREGIRIKQQEIAELCEAIKNKFTVWGLFRLAE